MSAPENHLKAALGAGRMQTGIWLALASPTAAEIASQAGFDWALIDAEHAPNDAAAILDQLRAMTGAPVTPVVRVPSADEVWIKRVLDLGVQSLLVPMIDSAEEAGAAVRAAHYPPEGTRGVGAALARATSYGARDNYVTTANAQICVIVQAESARALANIDAIAAVDGVDCVFIGPADLAADMGHPGDPGAPEVVAAIEDAIGRIKAAGKAAGIITFDPDMIAHYARLGVTFMGVGGDAVALSDAMRSLAARARDASA
ncbi:MAG: hypothetical protein HKO95_11055 [Rhodobacteraceae bacterium]|nr:hypothetical protein [Alphaproteobacteria bacterium]NNK67264.1 hypothetical protein [Paracoccaceae bacterium]